MTALQALGIVGTGGLGVLAAGLVIADALNSADLKLVFGLGLLVFVTAGAIALVARAAR